MCKEIPHLLTKKIPYSPHPNPLPKERECRVKGEGDINVQKSSAHEKGKHPQPDDQVVKAHCVETSEPEHVHHDHSEHHHEHKHHLHDDVVSLAHRHHDHQHLPLMHNHAPSRAHSCHAGDGHNHGESQPVASFGGGLPMVKPVGGGGHHHHEGEHEHCPKCDEHLVDNECSKCGYKS